MPKALLEINDLKVYYPVKKLFGFGEKRYVKAVDGVSLSINEGEAFGLVGESGCGKSTLGHTIVGLLDAMEGEIVFDGQPITGKGKKRNLELSKKNQIIFQDPYSSLDPRFTVGRCIAEPLVVHGEGNRESRKQRVLQLMRDVGLNEEQYTKFPHEFSGGQRQRIGVARALALDPKLIVCDEPVSALDVSIQAQILNLMQELQKKYNLTYVFISHNLSVVNYLCDRVAVMYLGNIVELAPKTALFAAPMHPYTQALLNAIPVPDPDRKSMEGTLTGDVPSPLDPPSGCCFHTRCSLCTEICRQEKPPRRELAPDHFVACHHAQNVAEAQGAPA
ncbi:ATP-binding cassette domain-containing protein [Ruminococcaceae bacterium OttesenSCG-928-O06]|nr:ATP-binding cassette domain-containing protein [Ruminococcaceae bacterium OttesenSCG-928-O06]